MSDNTKAIVGAVAVGTITAAGLAYLYLKNVDEPIPSKWKKIGEVVDLNCFLIKSCGPVKSKSFDCDVLGLKSEGYFDRSFVISQKNKQLTARTYPKMVLIQPEIVGNELILRAPDKEDFVLNLDDLRKKPAKEKVQLHYSKIVGTDAGDEAAEWLSDYIVGKPGVLRLIYYPHSYSMKGKSQYDKNNKSFRHEDGGAYHDDTSYMLINQASVDDINTHLDHIVKPLQFRPNMVIKGPNAYDEDNWKWVRIGDTVTFRSLKPCLRCIFANINPDTAERDPKQEPLETLKKYRTLFPNESPAMGLNLALRVPGSISIGDAVYINDDSEE